jgi:SH3-like domain-containing protein
MMPADQIYCKGRIMKLVLWLVYAVLFLSAPVYCDALCVKASVANVRSGPGTEYERVWQIYRFTPLRKVGLSTSGDWYAVRDVDGDVSWIHKTLVTGEYHCATVKSETVNVRTGPGRNYPRKFSEPARKYDSFRILGKKGAWIKVKDEWNNAGWVHSHYLWTD